MSLFLRKLLSRFLSLGVVDGDLLPAGTPADDPSSQEADGSEPTLDDLTALDAGGDEPTETPAEKSARERAERAERERDEERTTRRALEQRVTPAAPAVDPEAAREEAALAAARGRGATQAEIEMLQWTHQSNRTIRNANSTAQTALRQAADIRDQTAFDRLEITQPALHKKYAPRVEAEVAKLQSQGQSAPRLAIMDYLIGRDIREGKTKGTAKAAPAPVVDRGRMPSARSDVSGRRGVADERTKRMERLKGQQL